MRQESGAWPNLGVTKGKSGKSGEDLVIKWDSEVMGPGIAVA